MMTPLRKRMLEDLKRHNLAERTQQSYLSFIARLARHFGVSPDHLTREHLDEFRQLVRRWQERRLLPATDQLILTLAQDLFREPADLAMAHKLAVLLERVSERHTNWRLPELTEELAVIARNERRFLGLSDDPSRPRAWLCAPAVEALATEAEAGEEA